MPPDPFAPGRPADRAGALAPPRWLAWAGGALAFGVLAALAPALGGPTLSVLTLVLLFGYFGQAWNLMTGFAGQLSLGHALYVGIGGYATVLLSTRYGVSPWLGLAVGAALSAAAGAATGWLGFRFAVRGFQFALLTIAFAEFARIMVSNWDFVGGTAGLFLPALPPGASPLATLRGDAHVFFWEALVLAAAGMALTAWLKGSRLGYVWRAVRDDEDAARALGVRAFRHKLAATALSAGLTAVGGGLYGLYIGSLFPDSAMGLSLSIEIIVGPIVGGLGTVMGPVIGALLVIPLADLMGALGTRMGLYGLNNLVYGLVLVAVIWVVPDGIWPAVTRAAARAREGRAASGWRVVR